MSEKEEIKYWTDDWKQTFYASGDNSIINYLLKTGYDGIFISDVKE
jgi:endo-alpha-1,4-polygalactosaminidase (GH114 family)